MVIWGHIRNSSPYRLHANGSPDGLISDCGSRITEIILSAEILYFLEFSEIL